MTNEEDRIVALEIEATHLRQQNDELSEQLLAQWKKIDTLEQSLHKLAAQFQTLEQSIDPPNPLQKPPHW